MKDFVQGDRDATSIEECAKQLATTFAEKGIEVNLGAYGKLVEIFLAAGVKATCHEHRGKKGSRAQGQIVDCEQLLAGVGISAEQRATAAWGLRLGLLLSSDAFVFFPGQEGTLAHLLPAIAHASKGDPKPVALLGWEGNSLFAPLKSLLFPLLCNLNHVPPWLNSFRSDQVDDVISFLQEIDEQIRNPA